MKRGRNLSKKLQKSSIVYIDERLYREYGRALRGEKIYALAKDESIIGGWIGRRFVAPMTSTGGCDKEVLNLWLEQILLPQLQCG